MASSSGQPAGPSARRRGPAIATPPLDTAGAAKTTKRYSFSDTPMEMQAPKFNYPVTSPTNSTIDDSPITPASLNSRVLPIYTEPATTHAMVREEKARAHGQQPPPPESVHPAYFAPYREDSQREVRGQGQEHEQHQHQHQQQKRNPQHELHAPTENGTMPGVNITAPTPQTPTIPTPHSLSSPPPPSPPPAAPAAAAAATSTHLQPPPPTKKPSQTTASPTPALIVPDTAYPPPPTSTSTYPTPPQSQKTTWSTPLLSPSPGCILSLPLPCLCLPCLTYSKTSHRLSRRRAGRDPTNMLGYEPCNHSCFLFGLASVCGLCGVLAGWQRGRVRKTYGIEGDWGGDLLRGCGCCWCVVWGSEREVRVREEEERGRRERERGTGQYVSPTGEMVYAPPPRVGR